MEFEYKGANCVVITSNRAKVVIDGKISNLGLKDIAPKDAVLVATQEEFAPYVEDDLRVDQPGEYEIHDVSFKGIAADRMIDHADGSNQATMYRIDFGDVVVGVIGNVAAPLSDVQLEMLGVVDVLILPVGGNGYTLDPLQSLEVIRQIEPKVVIPVHYDDKEINYPVPQLGLELFTKEVSVPVEEMPKWKIKNGSLPESLTVIVIDRTS